MGNIRWVQEVDGHTPLLEQSDVSGSGHSLLNQRFLETNRRCYQREVCRMNFSKELGYTNPSCAIAWSINYEVRGVLLTHADFLH